MRVRREQMQKHFNAGTYRAIEAEIAMRAEQARRAKPIAPEPQGEVERIDTRTAEEIARAARAALRGEA